MYSIGDSGDARQAAPRNPCREQNLHGRGCINRTDGPLPPGYDCLNGSAGLVFVAYKQFNGCNEFVTLAGNSLDESRIISGIAQCVAKTLDGSIQASFKIYECVFAPEE